ncbi:hypothetical protein A2U01_0094297 [Trifolium medium]|uniref:Uncharacterized protein n=1 Tax=Trifolium medium TaxID=97028 RepID=A0A392UHF1_9FABA|nr:hypothetical protein [Trifolium medium]
MPPPSCRDTLRFPSDAGGRYLAAGITIRAKNWVLVEDNAVKEGS